MGVFGPGAGQHRWAKRPSGLSARRRSVALPRRSGSLSSNTWLRRSRCWIMWLSCPRRRATSEKGEDCTEVVALARQLPSRRRACRPLGVPSRLVGHSPHARGSGACCRLHQHPLRLLVCAAGGRRGRGQILGGNGHRGRYPVLLWDYAACVEVLRAGAAGGGPDGEEGPERRGFGRRAEERARPLAGCGA